MPRPAIWVDFATLYAGFAGQVTNPATGIFPDQPYDDILPTVEATRQAAVRIAREREIGCILTNWMGAPRGARF